MEVKKNGTYSKCKFIFNDKEWNNCKITGTSDFFEGNYLVKIVRPSKKARAKEIMFEKSDYIKSFNKTQAENPNVRVIPFFQFPDNFKLDKKNLKITREIQLDSNLKVAVFQEGSRKESVEKFKLDLTNFLLDKRTENRETFLLLSSNSKKIRLKLNVAFELGLRNFIIKGGKYSDIRFWVGIISKIHAENGKVFCSIPKRYENESKISYMKPLVNFGADYVFHQAFSPPPMDEPIQNIVYLGKGLKYFGTLSEKNVKEFLVEDFKKNLDKILSLNKGKEYELSRIISIKATPNLFRGIVIYEILKTP